jgi:hypothetical protein
VLWGITSPADGVMRGFESDSSDTARVNENL